MSGASARPGFAAPLALCMLVAVAGLAAGSFYAVVEARRASNRAARQEEAAGGSDIALHRVLGSWDVARRDSLRVGEIDSAGSAPDQGRVVVTRITERLFWLAAAGRAAPGTSVEATRAQHLLLEVLRPTLPLAAAVVSRGDVLVDARTDLAGRDSPPPGWTDCPSADATEARTVLVPHGRAARLDTGDPIPGAASDSLAGDRRTYDVLGAVRTESLAERADIAVAAGATISPVPSASPDCRSGAPGPAMSWGEPARTGLSAACERYYPVVHTPGDLIVTAGRGQGVLIVGGRLRIEGPFTFAGVILAFGGVSVTGSDVVIYGTVLAAAGGVDWRGTGALRRSRCAVERAATAAARAYPAPLRAWAELF